jgi:hypothetical protein
MTSIRRIVAVVAVVVIFGASAGSALAGQFNVSQGGTYVQIHPSVNQPAALKDGEALPTVLRVVGGWSVFAGGDAGRGAGAGVAIAVIVLGAGLGLSQRRAGGIRHA